MVLYHDEASLNAYILSEIFIDEQFQGKGYGRSATKRVLDNMKKDGKYNKVILCYMEGNDAAKKLYEEFGFVETDRDEDEILFYEDNPVQSREVHFAKEEKRLRYEYLKEELKKSIYHVKIK